MPRSYKMVGGLFPPTFAALLMRYDRLFFTRFNMWLLYAVFPLPQCPAVVALVEQHHANIYIPRYQYQGRTTTTDHCNNHSHNQF
jgi:hypothetical protein